MEWTVFIDMDTVLTDFATQACRLYGLDPEGFDTYREPGVWEITGPIGLMSGHGKVTTEEFWDRVDAIGPPFWSDMPWLPWADHLIHEVERLFGDDSWYILSAPSDHPSAHAGKVESLQKKFGEGFNRFILTPHKHLVAKPRTLLIDDRERNVERFREAGGHAVLFPDKGNRLHYLIESRMIYLTNRLEDLHAL